MLRSQLRHSENHLIGLTGDSAATEHLWVETEPPIGREASRQRSTARRCTYDFLRPRDCRLYSTRQTTDHAVCGRRHLPLPIFYDTRETFGGETEIGSKELEKIPSTVKLIYDSRALTPRPVLRNQQASERLMAGSRFARIKVILPDTHTQAMSL